MPPVSRASANVLHRTLSLSHISGPCSAHSLKLITHPMTLRPLCLAQPQALQELYLRHFSVFSADKLFSSAAKYREPRISYFFYSIFSRKKSVLDHYFLRTVHELRITLTPITEKEGKFCSPFLMTAFLSHAILVNESMEMMPNPKCVRFITGKAHRSTCLLSSSQFPVPDHTTFEGLIELR